MNGFFRHQRVAAERSRYSFRWFFALVLACAPLLQTGCGPKELTATEKTAVKAGPVYNLALTYLKSADYAKAAIEFNKLLVKEPDDSQPLYYNALVEVNPDLLDRARFGYVVSNVLAKINDAVTSVATVLGAVVPLIGGSSGAPVALTPQNLVSAIESQSPRFSTMAVGIESIIDDLLANIRDFIVESLDELAKIKKSPDFRMNIDPLPIKFLNINIMQIGGEFDLGEVYFILSVGSIIASALDGIRAITLDIGVDTLLSDLLPYIKELPSSAFTIEKLPDTLMNIVPVILHLEPNLFGVQDTKLVQLGADEMADGAGYFQKMVEAIRSDAVKDTNQQDDLIGYVLVDGTEYMEFHYQIEIAIPGVSLQDFEGLQIEIRDDVNNAVDNIEKAFRGKGAGTVEWARDIVPLISLAVVTVLRTGALNGLIQAAISTDGSASTDSNPILDIINSPIITPDVVGGLITEFIPDVFRFNVKAYLKEPRGGLRVLFPMWTMPQNMTNDNSRIREVHTVADTQQENILFHPYSKIRFIYEYECIDKTTKAPVDHIVDSKFVCGDTDEVRDFAPFSGITVPVYGIKVTAAASFLTDNTFLSSFQLFANAGTFTDAGTDTVFVVPILDGDDTNWLFTDPKYDAWFGASRELQVMYEPLYKRDNFVAEHSSQTVNYNESITETGASGYGLKSDGMKSVLPYIAFQDASLGGLIEYNFSRADLSTDAENQLGDLMDWTGSSTSYGALSRALNALVALVGEKVGGLLGGL